MAYDDYATTYEDQPVSGYVLANDTDADGHALAAALLSSTANGTVSLGANGFFLSTPAANFSGYDSFDYAVADGYGGTDVGTVWITVIAVNDPPVLPPYTFTTDEDDSCGGVVSGSDPDGDVLICTVETGPMHGTVILNPDGSFTYTPDENYHGTDEFGYSVSDGHGGSATGTVTFTIASVNDGPAITGNTTYGTTTNTAISIAWPSIVSDADGDALTASGHTQGSHGSVGVSGSSMVYTPATGFEGTDTFAFTVSDGRGGTLTVTVTVTVSEGEIIIIVD